MMVGTNLREEILTSCKATAMIYNDSQKKWLHCAANGPAKIQLLFSNESQTYRIVGRQIQDHEVVLNHSISKGIKYNQATATFHQWRDQTSVYGLNFSSKLDAQDFGMTMLKIVENLNGTSTSIVNGGATLPNSSSNSTPNYKRQSSQPPVETYFRDDEETNYALISDSCAIYNETKPSNIPPAPPLNLPLNPPAPPPAPPTSTSTTRKSFAPQMDLMSEMAAKFAQRRKLIDENETNNNNNNNNSTINVKNSTKISTTSPCVTRKLNENVSTSIDFDKFKLELLAEIRKDIEKAKQEILNALFDQNTKI